MFLQGFTVTAVLNLNQGDFSLSLWFSGVSWVILALFLRQVKTNSGPKGENHLSMYSRSLVDSFLSSTDWWLLLITYMWCCCWWAPPAGGSGGFWQCLASGWCLRGTGTCCGPRTRRHLRSLWRRDRGETGQGQRLRESLHTFTKDRFLITFQ